MTCPDVLVHVGLNIHKSKLCLLACFFRSGSSPSLTLSDSTEKVQIVAASSDSVCECDKEERLVLELVEVSLCIQCKRGRTDKLV